MGINYKRLKQGMVKKYINMYGDDLADGFEQYSALEQFSKKRARVKI